MKCKEAVYEIAPFCRGDMEEQKEKEFKRHTTVCKDCARSLFRIRKTLEYLYANVPEIKTVDLTGDIQIKYK
ncbi:MAG: hypothetical protein LBL00_04600 [Endomicrobium sp.]|jgi:hypothetical protein|nr:hypothetical protein [Endomicrobium sp.]